MRILVASTNAGKRDELVTLLGPLGIEVVSPADVGGLPEVVEDRSTFAGNAAKKALAAARAAGIPALADDSGLEVDALGGAPGVLSARFAGEPPDDERNNDRLLRELADVPEERRGARFVCALALADPSGALLLEVEATAHGRILFERRGSRGFGYDPLFLFTEEGHAQAGRAFAELEPSEKARVSHRGRAVASLVRSFPELLERASRRAGRLQRPT